MKLLLQSPRQSGLYLKIRWMHGDADFYDEATEEVTLSELAAPSDVLERAKALNDLLKPMRGNRNAAIDRHAFYALLNNEANEDEDDVGNWFADWWPSDRFYGPDAGPAELDEYSFEYVDPQTGLVFDVIED